EINNTTRLQRADIVYFDDGLLIGAFNKSIATAVAATDTTKFFTQISLDRGRPRRWVITFARGSLYASLSISGLKWIVHRGRTNNRAIDRLNTADLRSRYCDG